VNTREGFRRIVITLSVISALVWIVVAIADGMEPQYIWVLILVILGTIAGLWLIYGLLLFIVGGFSGKK
jgi:hypothetical protein